jgi:hypothetical protein
VENDANYWIENDWQVAVELASYPDVAKSGGYSWETTSNSIKYFLDSSKTVFRQFSFDSTTLKFNSFVAIKNGIQSNICLLK